MGFPDSVSPFPRVRVESFSLTREIPESGTGCLLLDLRETGLFDSDARDDLRGRNGKDAEVFQYVLSSPTAYAVLERTCDQVQALITCNTRWQLPVRILIGDERGRTRSVVIADMLTDILNARGITAECLHHHLGASS